MNKSFRDHLIAALARYGATVPEQARATGFAERTIYQWRAGRNLGNLERLARIGVIKINSGDEQA